MPFHYPELTHAQFMWIWRIIESKAFQHHEHPTRAKINPDYMEVVLGATAAFRAASEGGITIERPKPAEAPRKKRVLRKSG